MARPANRLNRKQDSDKTMYQTALYMRLSYGSIYTESDSIVNQRKILDDYITCQDDMVVIAEFVDDGKSGINFERPAFEKMLKAVRNGEVNCIIVKDLSRFGRNYTEAGDYLERIFPFLGVRFISVLDHYDSNNPACDKEQLLIPLKNLMHDMYARDISKKVKTSLRAKRQKGDFYPMSKIPYGYRKGKGCHELDESAAPIVKEMFERYDKGEKIPSICNELNERQISSPEMYRKTGMLYNQDEGKSLWIYSTVKKMLQNKVYIGTMVDGKIPALIDKEMFERVHRKLESTKQEKQRHTICKTENIFSDVLFCGVCGSPMTRVGVTTYVNKQRVVQKGYTCSLHRQAIRRCAHKETMKEKELCDIINRFVVTQSKALKDLREQIRKNSRKIFQAKTDQIKKDMGKCMQKIELLEEERRNALLKYHLEGYNREKVVLFRDRQLEMIVNEKENIIQFQKRNSKICHFEKQYRRIMYEWSRYQKTSLPSVRALASMIKRIEVYPGKKVVIKLLYQDEIQETQRSVESGGKQYE